MAPRSRRLPQATAQAMLWESVQTGEVEGAVHAVVGGADLNTPFHTDAAAHLAEDAEVRCTKLSSGGDPFRAALLGEPPQHSDLLGTFTIVHYACQVCLSLWIGAKSLIPFPRLHPPPLLQFLSSRNACEMALPGEPPQHSDFVGTFTIVYYACQV